MLFLYDVVVFFYGLFIKVAALFSTKARKWVKGRKNWQVTMQKETPNGGFDLWMHVSSLGEFEQGRPVLEAYRSKNPSSKILLSFFSPSGYEIRKNYKTVDHVAYLPLDTASNAKTWLEIVQPKHIIFVKYDFWFNFLNAIKNSSTHAILISANFSTSHFFNSWMGKNFKESLLAFKTIFFQKRPEFDLNKSIVSKVVGDTRVDRVLKIQRENEQNKKLDEWLAGRNVFVWGSVWERDLNLLQLATKSSLKDWKHIIAPHEPTSANIEAIKKKCFLKHQLLSLPISSDSEAVIVDSIGQLSGLYRFGSAAYIGGGFGKGIHNTLEPLAANCPVIIGPNFEKFPEAVDGIQHQVVFSIKNENDFQAIVGQFNQRKYLSETQKKCATFISSKSGATKEILDYLESIG